MSSTQKLSKLNEKHELFVLEFISRGLRGLEAAHKAAGFAGTRQSAHQLRHDPLIKKRIAELMADRFKSLHMDVDEILARTASIARADVRGLFNEDGNLRNPGELDDTEAAAIAGIEIAEEFDKDEEGKKRLIGYTKKVRLRDPMPALRLLAEYKKLVKQPDDGVNALASALAERMKAARERQRSKKETKR